MGSISLGVGKDFNYYAALQVGFILLQNEEYRFEKVVCYFTIMKRLFVSQREASKSHPDQKACID